MSTRCPALFLDKDGTLLEDEPFNVDPQRMRLVPSAADALARLARLGVPMIVVSNQAGVALGHFDIEQLEAVRVRLASMFEECGARLTGFHFCPHHPEASVARYARRCQCRKPAPGLLLHAAQAHSIDLHRSWLIGDILDDVEAARRAGCRSVLICDGHETEWRGGALRTPHHLVRDMGEAARLVADAWRDHQTQAAA